jgi:hypothetical protein
MSAAAANKILHYEQSEWLLKSFNCVGHNLQITSHKKPDKRNTTGRRVQFEHSVFED